MEIRIQKSNVNNNMNNIQQKRSKITHALGFIKRSFEQMHQTMPFENTQGIITCIIMS